MIALKRYVEQNQEPMAKKIEISHLTRAEVLMRLFNRARPYGYGSLRLYAERMTYEEAEEHIKRAEEEDNYYFEYIRGRKLNIDLKGKVLYPAFYDREYGHRAAEKALFDPDN